ncbi:MAG: SpoIID/LytB domain-containing protein [Firmicutes bacterium]|nr:SpoIID/LytB domain-containing protein [Bacillota bacterium]
MYKRLSPVALLCALLLVANLIGGCAQKPQQKPGGGKVPPIPEAISKGANVEPELKVYFHENGTVKTMKLEEYIQGVVAGEMGPDWPDKAFAAQAILARTFTLQKIAEKPKLDNRDANASTNKSEFQAYDAAKVNDRIKKAVESTRGKVLVYNGDYVRAWFHAYSGGKTATAKDGLDFTQAATPYIASVNDSQFDTAIPDDVKTWKASFSLDQVQKAVKQINGSDPGKVTSIVLGPKNPSDRIDTIKVNNVEVKTNALRTALDSTVFKSTMLNQAQVQGGKAVFAGRGYGHGVGMSQWGARVMADQGKSPEDIVGYYFKNTNLVSLYQ